MKFFIYHPAFGEMNYKGPDTEQHFELIGTIEADSLNDAWPKSQNDFNRSYASFGKRSTSVGDIISTGRVHYMVMGTGFKIVEMEDVLQEA